MEPSEQAIEGGPASSGGKQMLLRMSAAMLQCKLLLRT
jgi:hypothetical protein